MSISLHTLKKHLVYDTLKLLNGKITENILNKGKDRRLSNILKQFKVTLVNLESAKISLAIKRKIKDQAFAVGKFLDVLAYLSKNYSNLKCLDFTFESKSSQGIKFDLFWKNLLNFNSLKEITLSFACILNQINFTELSSTFGKLPHLQSFTLGLPNHNYELKSFQEFCLGIASLPKLTRLHLKLPKL